MRLLLIALVTGLALAGCGNSAESPAGPTPAERRAAIRAERELALEEREQAQLRAEVRKMEREPVEVAPESKPEPGHGERPLVSSVQREARELCSVFSQAQMAKEYGVPNSLPAVASAVASEYRSGLQVNAEEGCIEGLAE